MRLPEMKEISLVGDVRAMKTKDIPQVFKLYKEMTAKYEISFKFSQDELAHHLMPRKGVIVTLVVENSDENDKKVITDFVSFYHLPSSILKCKDVPHDYKTLNVSQTIQIFFIFLKIDF